MQSTKSSHHCQHQHRSRPEQGKPFRMPRPMSINNQWFQSAPFFRADNTDPTTGQILNLEIYMDRWRMGSGPMARG